MPPKNPKKPGKKVAAKPPGKEAAKKGPHAPFTKPRKAPTQKTKPGTWTEAEWEADCMRRKYSTADRRERHLTAGAKKASTTNAKHVAALAACAAAASTSPWSGPTGGPAYIPGTASLSTPSFFANPGCATLRFSPQYEDAVAHSGFNPYAVFSPDAVPHDKHQQVYGEDGVAFTGRRGPLEFKEGTGNPFYGMLAHGEEQAAYEDGEEDEEEEAEDGKEEEGEYDEEDEDEEEEEKEAEEAEEVIEVDAAGKKKKKKKAATTGTRGPKWKDLEDQCLCDSWATVTVDSVTGANQRYGAYWARIKAEFDERKFLDKDYRTMVMKRSQKAMSTRWAIIQGSVNMFHGFHGELEARGDSGSNPVDLVRAPPPLVASLSMYLYIIVFALPLIS